MTIQNFVNQLDKLYPRSLSCSWDNDGIMVSRDTAASVKRVLISLDATGDVLKYACDSSYCK